MLLPTRFASAVALHIIRRLVSAAIQNDGIDTIRYDECLIYGPALSAADNLLAEQYLALWAGIPLP